ncbi:P-loop NTPase [uncultured Methanomethylovorans sp.]|uniref:MinD/ParA family ATP-binding protein n=1 Tax=uncultured Methanomethylovorans sp. TaxID=183759 RepID=UPI002AA91E20|nr:P-loop NTPase [uncultured Methanomethylovorans sp.]
MGVTVAVHSSKGGTGKTCISLNLAALLASDGNNVCLLDMDLKAPSLCTFFNLCPKWWLNEYLDGKCNIDSVLHEVSSQLGTNGKFAIGFSNPDINAIRTISNMERKWQAKALKFLLDAKKSLFQSGIDVLILDTGPGLEFESVNAIAISDIVLSVMIPGNISYRSTEQLVKGVYKKLEKKYYLVENMSHNPSVYLSGKKDVYGMPILVSIPCMCDVPLKNGLCRNATFAFILT